jgi:hypothetical protein
LRCSADRAATRHFAECADTMRRSGCLTMRDTQARAGAP